MNKSEKYSSCQKFDLINHKNGRNEVENYNTNIKEEDFKSSICVKIQPKKRILY